MTLRPIAPHEVGEMGANGDWRIGPPAVAPVRRPVFGHEAYRPSPMFGAIVWAGLGERAATGVTGIHANPRIRNP